MTHKPWSKLKSKIESLWVNGLPLSIYCSVYRYSPPHAVHSEANIPRHWFTLNGEVIYDFPGPFLVDNPPRGSSIRWFEDVYSVINPAPKPIDGIPTIFTSSHDRSSIISQLLREYIDRPRELLMEPFHRDEWEFTDILRAADGRIGKNRLRVWEKTLDAGNPAQKVLKARFDK